MATESTTQITDRDIAVLSVLEQLPLTPQQILRWSERFDSPFPEISIVHRRLRKLAAAGLVRRWPYAIASEGGSPHYYKPTLDAYRLLRDDPLATSPNKRAFASIGPGLHHHTKSLTDFIVHIAVHAHRLGVRFCELHGENQFRIHAGNEMLRADGHFLLSAPGGNRRYCVELDNSTETLISPRDVDSIGRKIRLYEDHQAEFSATDPRRYVTVFVTTRSRRRALNILEVASSLVRNPQRSLFYAAYLPDILEADSLATASFLDQRSQSVAILPESLLTDAKESTTNLVITPALC